jgi:surface antigen
MLPSVAEYKSEWQVREFVAGQTLQGVTAKDRESWSVRMESDGSFRMQHTNRSVDRGRWVVQGRQIQFLFDRGNRSICRMLYVDSSGTQEWHACEGGQALSIIVAPRYDAFALDGANQRKAESARQGQALFRDIQRGMPGGGQSAAIVGDLVDRYMDDRIARLLSPEGRRQHAMAVQRAWVTGQPQVWTNPSANERGRVELGERRTDGSGRVRQSERAEVYKDGHAYETQRDICFGPDGAYPCA